MSIFLPILEYSEALSRIDFSKSDRRTQAWCAKAFSVQGSQDIQIYQNISVSDNFHPWNMILISIASLKLQFYG